MPAGEDGAGVSGAALAIPDVPLLAAGVELGLAGLLPGVPPVAALGGLVAAVAGAMF